MKKAVNLTARLGFYIEIMTGIMVFTSGPC
jgi:hypothetical protein